jgi:UDP-N-acetylglucosamine 2-epimerase
MRVLSIVGARPQFVKLAPISWTSEGIFEHKILHTGQHYDPMLSEIFFQSLKIPNPDFQLKIGSGPHGEQTGRMLIEIERVLVSSRPDHVILYGDTNSTLAGAIATQKLNIPISHVEAGLRSFNRVMPEEINRVVTDHCSNLLFAPTISSMINLRNEGLGDSSILSGDVMVETLEYIRNEIPINSESSNFLIATIHRPENTDNPERMIKIMGKLKDSPIKIHLHCHPRLRNVLEELNLMKDSENLTLLPPLDYLSLVRNVIESKGVVTDSGGLQKEAYILKKPCMVLRTESEWVETLETGRSFLDPNLERINQNWWSPREHGEQEVNIFGDGSASKTIISAIRNYKG